MQLVLGTAQLTEKYGVLTDRNPTPEMGRALAILAAATDLGITTLDTAPAYGSAERVIGAQGKSFRVHTKFDPRCGPAESLRRSLVLLERERVDGVYFHDQEALHSSAQLDEAFEAVRSGADWLGCSVYDEPAFEVAVVDPRITAIQCPINIFDRRFVRDIPAAQQAGSQVFARSVLLQGVLIHPTDTLPDSVVHLRPYLEKVDDIASRAERPRLELAVGWVRQLPGLAGLVIGVDHVEDLREIAAAFVGPPLDADLLAELYSLELPPPTWCDPRRWS